MIINFAYGFAVPQKALEFGALIVAAAWIEGWQQGEFPKELRFQE
jgi:hypothetical protein